MSSPLTVRRVWASASRGACPNWYDAKLRALPSGEDPTPPEKLLLEYHIPLKLPAQDNWATESEDTEFGNNSNDLSCHLTGIP